MNKNQLIRYIVRLLATLLNISTCITLGIISVAYVQIFVNIIMENLFPITYFIVFGGGGAILFALAWTVGCVLFAILFIRSLFATIEARYPKKLFRRLGGGIAWCFIVNTLGLISHIGAALPLGPGRSSTFILAYFIGLGASLLMLIPALQFWRPSATKTWVLNILTLLLCSSVLFVPREYLALIMVRVMQLF